MRSFGKSKRYVFGLMALLTAALFALSGCGSAPSGSGGSSGAKAAKVMTVGVNLFSTTLDPHKDYDGWFVVRYGLGETLARVSDEMALTPWLATKWEMVDEHTWKITLRDGVKFHTGTPMTAEAVKASLARSVATNKRGPANLSIDTMEAAGQVLTIRTKEARPDLIYELCDPYCAIVDVKAAEGPEGFRKTVAGTGPFKVKDFTENISVTVTAFDEYWGGRAKLDEAIFRYLNDPDTRMMSLQSGDIDASINIDSKNLQLFEDKTKYTVSRCPSMRATYVFFNTKNRFLQDKNLRTALIMAADKKNYLKSVLGGVGVEGVCLYPTSLPYRSAELQYPAFDPAGAKKLLADNGYVDQNGDGHLEKDGETVTLTISCYTSRAEIPSFATAMQADFEKLGIATKIVTYDTLPREKFTAGDYDIGFTSFSPSTNTRPLAGLRTAFVKDSIENYYNYFYDERVEEIARALPTEADYGKQDQMAFEAQQRILDARTNIFLAYTENLYVSNHRVKNFNAHAFDYYVMDNQVDIESK
ncbi:MAG: ABC transporter substrate-binding protein [Schwartzia sp. (in: firmicutes)]